MAAINFPNSPTDGETHTANNVTWTFESAKGVWRATTFADAPTGDKGQKGEKGQKGQKGDTGVTGEKGQKAKLVLLVQKVRRAKKVKLVSLVQKAKKVKLAKRVKKVKLVALELLVLKARRVNRVPSVVQTSILLTLILDPMHHQHGLVTQALEVKYNTTPIDGILFRIHHLIELFNSEETLQT